MESSLSTALVTMNWLVLFYFLVLNSFYVFLIVISFREIRKYLSSLYYGAYDRIFADFMSPPISLIVPVYNEELNVDLTIQNMLHLRYPKYELIVINDGSKDQTMKVLIDTFKLLPRPYSPHSHLPTKRIRAVYYSPEYPSLCVIDKENGGKADALNAGINVSQYEYFLSVDGDAILEEDSLLRIIRPVVENPKQVVGVGGIVRVANGCKFEKGRVTIPRLSDRLLPVIQVVEYLRAFLTGRTALSWLNCNLIISGAFGLFNKEMTLRVGGYKTGIVGEDMELVTSLHSYLRELKKDYKIVFIGDPVCWTEVPETIKVLSRQRRRWQKGLMEVLTTHRKMLFNSNYGSVGWVGFPYFYFFEGWGSLIEVAGYVTFALSLYFGVINWLFAAAFFCATVLLGVVISLLSLILEEFSFRRYPRFRDLGRLVLISVIENFGYRQLISFFRFLGLLDFIRNKGAWGDMERRGIARI